MLRKIENVLYHIAMVAVIGLSVVLFCVDDFESFNGILVYLMMWVVTIISWCGVAVWSQRIE